MGTVPRVEEHAKPQDHRAARVPVLRPGVPDGHAPQRGDGAPQVLREQPAAASFAVSVRVCDAPLRRAQAAPPEVSRALPFVRCRGEHGGTTASCGWFAARRVHTAAARVLETAGLRVREEDYGV